MSDCQTRTSWPSSTTIFIHDVICGRVLTVPGNSLTMELEGTKFMIKRRVGRSPGCFPGFSTPNRPLRTFSPLYSKTSSNGVQRQTPLLINSCAIASISPSCAWIFPCSLGSFCPTSLTTFFMGLERKSTEDWEKKRQRSMEPPCSHGGNAGKTCCSESLWHVPTSSPT